MTRSDRLKPVLNVAQKKETQEAQLLGKVQRELMEQTNKLAALSEYQKEYQQRFKQQASQGMSAAQLHSYQQFIANLETAITEQRKCVSRVQEACDSQKRQWDSKRIKAKVLDNVMTRYLSDEDHVKQRREQRNLDEMVSTQFWHLNHKK